MAYDIRPEVNFFQFSICSDNNTKSILLLITNCVNIRILDRYTEFFAHFFGNCWIQSLSIASSVEILI